MIKKPFFSIIIATFNSEKTLDRCFQSILKQSFKDWEIILIDGKSKDSTMKIVESYKRNISFYISETDSGIYEAMNKGVKNSSGKFLFFLNSDDEFFDKNVLRDVHKFINNKKEKIDLITANVLKVFPSFSVLKNTLLSEKNLKRGLMPPHQSMFINSEIFKKIGGYDVVFKSSGDFEFCCKFYKANNNFFYYNRLISKFSSGGMSHNKKIAYPETYQIIKNYFGYYHAILFFLKRIIIEQSLKKILELLNLNKAITFFTKIAMKASKE